MTNIERNTLQSNIRKVLYNKLTMAGMIAIIDKNDYNLPNHSLQSAVKQSALTMGITIRMKTIDGQLHIMRTDLGIDNHDPMLDHDTEMKLVALHSFHPWPNDSDYDLKQSVINQAACLILKQAKYPHTLLTQPLIKDNNG